MLQLSIWRVSMLVAMVALIFASCASATPHFPFEALFRRQGTGTSATGTSRTTTPTQTPTSTPTSTTSTPSSTPPSQTTSTPTSTPTSEPSSTPPSSSATSASASRTITTSSALMGTSTVLSTTVIVSTDAGNNVVTITSTSSRLESSVTGYVPVTSTVPKLGSDGSSNGNGGLSSANKKVIGGVVGGIGGAILLAGIAYAVWRNWGNRKRYNPEDDIDYTAGTGQGLGSSGSAKEDGIAHDNDHESRYTGSTVRPNAAANF